MEIKKNDRMVFYRRVAIGTGSSLLVILGVTLLGMSVFSPSGGNQIALDARRIAAETNIRPALIGSHEAQAADTEFGEHLDSLADTLEKVVSGDNADTGTAASGEMVEARDSGENSDEEITITLNKKDIEAAAEAGVAAVGLWGTVWGFVWPKLQAFGSAIWGIFSS